MVEQAHNLQNARLAAKLYGQGKAKNAVEVAFIKKIIGPGYAGLRAAAVCVIGAWLGGARERSLLSPSSWMSSGTPQEACADEFGSDLPDVEDALDELRALSPALADLVEVKGEAKQANDAIYLWQSFKEDVAEAVPKVATDTAKVVGNTLGTIGGGLAEGAAGAAGGLFSGFFKALPWWLIIGGIVALVGLGVALWFFLPRLSAASAGVGVAATKAAPLLL